MSARGMAPAASTDAGHLPRLRRDVIDDVVRTVAISADTARNMVEIKIVSGAPGDVVIGARGVAAHANGAHERAAGGVQREPAAEHVHTTDASTDHRVVRLPVIGWVATIRDVDIDRIAFLKTEEAASWLHGGVEIRGREREAGKAECVRRVGLLRRNHATARPLITATISCECDRADDTIAVDDGCPQVESEPAIGCVLR